jgi:hypothetical protein
MSFSEAWCYFVPSKKRQLKGAGLEQIVCSFGTDINVRFGSLADIEAATESRHPPIMSPTLDVT